MGFINILKTNNDQFQCSKTLPRFPVFTQQYPQESLSLQAESGLWKF